MQISEQGFKDIAKKLCENVRLQRALQAKVSLTNDILEGRTRLADKLFSALLTNQHDQNLGMLEKLKKEKSKLEKEIVLRNCLGNMTAPLRSEVQRCLSEGYEVKSHTHSSVILSRRSPCLSGSEQLKLCIGAAGRVQRIGENCTSLQSRLDALISLYKVYRTLRPTPGREKQVLDKQFELDAEINALYREMKYLGYAPNLGDYIL